MVALKNFIILLSFLILITTDSLYAEFKETSINVFQNINEEYKIVVTKNGIFVIETNKIDIKSFSLADLTKEKVKAHCFIEYNSQTNKYDKLLLGKHTFKIAGSFNLKIGKLHVNVDKLNTYSSYVVYDKNIDDNIQGILGVIGATVVVNTTGSSFVALLEANAMSGLNISTYEVKDENLFLNDTKVKENEKIGTTVNLPSNKSSCLAKTSVILNESDLKEIKKISTDLEKVEAFFSKKQSQDIIKDFLIIRIENSSIILLDYINADIKIVKQLGNATKSNRNVCYIKNIDIDSL